MCGYFLKISDHFAQYVIVVLPASSSQACSALHIWEDRRKQEQVIDLNGSGW